MRVPRLNAGRICKIVGNLRRNWPGVLLDCSIAFERYRVRQIPYLVMARSSIGKFDLELMLASKKHTLQCMEVW